MTATQEKGKANIVMVGNKKYTKDKTAVLDAFTEEWVIKKNATKFVIDCEFDKKGNVKKKANLPVFN